MLQNGLKNAQNQQIFTLLTSKCASHHNDVHCFDISTSKSGPTLVCFVHFDLEMCFAHLRTTTARRFSSFIWPAGFAPATVASLLFRPSGATKHGKKTQHFATFRPFRTPFFWLSSDFLLTCSSILFSSLLFSSILWLSLLIFFSAFHLSILWEVWLLNFLRWLDKW